MLTYNKSTGNTAVLEKIWLACFDDSPAFASRFISFTSCSAEIITAVSDGETVGAAYFIPAVLENRKALYCYGAGVLPAFRGNGIMRGLLETVFNRCDEDGSFMFLVPANEHLAGYYASLGMKSSLRLNEVRIKPQSSVCSVIDVTNTEYISERSRFCKIHNGIIWSDDYTDFVLNDNASEGGRTVKISTSDESAFAVLKEDGDVLNVTEILTENPENILQAAAYYFAKSEVKAFIMKNAPGYIPVMTYNFAENNTYVNLLLN